MQKSNCVHIQKKKKIIDEKSVYLNHFLYISNVLYQNNSCEVRIAYLLGKITNVIFDHKQHFSVTLSSDCRKNIFKLCFDFQFAPKENWGL